MQLSQDKASEEDTEQVMALYFYATSIVSTDAS